MRATSTQRRAVPPAGEAPDLRAAHAPHLTLVEPPPAAASAKAGPPAEAARIVESDEKQAFCARLRSTRERRGMSLAAIAEATKVHAPLFEALERGDLSRWPKGLYRRSFFRGYAAAIGLPSGSTLEEFLGLFPDEVSVPAAAPLASAADTPLRLTLVPEARRLRILFKRRALIDGSAVLVLALLLVWWSDAPLPAAAAIVLLCCFSNIAAALRSRPRRARIALQTGHGGSDKQDPPY